MAKGRISAILAGAWIVLGALPAHSQTAVWTGGGGSDSNYSASKNWSGGVAPPNDGSNLLDLTASEIFSGYYDADIGVDTGANVSGVVFLPASTNSYYYVYGAGGTLTIGSNGISMPGSYYSYGQFAAPIVLSASQTWSTGSSGELYVDGSISESGGSRALTLAGQVYLIGDNSFTGGVNVASNSTLYVGSNTAAGTGTINLADNSYLDSYYPSSNPVILANAVALGNNVTFGTYGPLNTANTLAFSGPITAENGATTLNLSYDSIVEITGTGSLTGSTPTVVTLSGNGATLPSDGGSLMLMEGTLSNVTGITVSNAALIMAPSSSPSTALSGVLPSGLVVGAPYSPGYLGLDGAFTQEGAVYGFLSAYGIAVGSSINGTLGFDSFANPSTPNVFNDPVDLSGFDSLNFIGLGSATAAILGPSATITPTPSGYLFGGGGGTLTVESNLTGSSPLIMNQGPEPLTLILQGTNTYTGGTQSNGGVLIFNSAPPSGSGSITLNGGYVGYTQHAGVTPDYFIGLISSGVANGVIGFDSSGSPQVISGDISLSAFNDADAPFLGTATEITLSTTATIEPANGTYQFAGVKGGQLTVNSTLMGPTNSVVVGLPTPIEDNGSISSVTLGGPNTYGGGTTFNNGILYVTNSMSLGTGTLTADNYGTPVLAPLGASVTLGNAVALGSYTQLTLGQSGNANLLTLNGAISGSGSLLILSDVALNGANTYSGGTSIDGTYLNDLNIAIGNPSALGTGPVDLSYANLTENITNPTFVDLANGYSSSINLVPSSTLTLYADTGEGNYWAYEGAINGDGTDQVVKTGPGVEYLSGNSTYGGGTTVVAGHLIAGSSAALGTGAVTVDSGAGLGVDTGVTLTDPINNLAGSGLGGMGTFSPPSGVTFAGGSKVSPGSDGTIAPYIGTLSFGTPVTFGTGGIYVFDIANASGAAGVGYDTLNLTSSLTISATSGTPFNIAVESIDPGTSETGPASFNSSQSYTWTLLTAAPILGTFNSADFSVDLTNFQNSTGGGSFAVGETGDTLTLNFTPVPEPSTWMLMAAGLAALCIRYRRPRRA